MISEEKNGKENVTINDEEFLKERVVFMEGDFNEENCNKIKKQLLYLMTHNPKEDITIYISSYGGSLYDFFTIYGLIKTLKCKLTTIALGKCMSAGAYLLLLGDNRLAYPEATIMLHELASWDSYKKLHDQANRFEEAKRLQKILDDLVKKKTKIKNVREYLKEDRFESTVDAKVKGIISRVIK